MLGEIRANVSKALFRNLMFDLYNRLKTPRKRVVAQRHLEILKLLLDSDSLLLSEITTRTKHVYSSLTNPYKALVRDINDLIRLGAIRYDKLGENQYRFAVRLERPTEITETKFFERVKQKNGPTKKGPFSSLRTSRVR